MILQDWFHRRHQFRVALCGHKAAEAAGACLLLMVQGNVLALTATHFAIASKTGLVAVAPALALTFTPFAKRLVNRWTSSTLLAVCTFFADSMAHASHYPGEYTEAALTALGAFVFSVVVSYTAVGRFIDRLAESFLHHHSPV